jgi:type II secretory pathway pseudopilin PulG
MLIAGGCLLAVIFVLLALILRSSVGSHSETPQASKLQAAITSELQQELSENKQKLYEKIHVAGEFGTAKSDVIQAVSMQWKGGHPTDDPADLSGFTVDHTLYWSTPLTSDGYTKFEDTYDSSGGTPQLTNSRVIATNGITIEGATNALIDYGAQQLTKAVADMLNGTPAPSPAP